MSLDLIIIIVLLAWDLFLLYSVIRATRQWNGWKKRSRKFESILRTKRGALPVALTEEEIDEKFLDPYFCAHCGAFYSYLDLMGDPICGDCGSTRFRWARPAVIEIAKILGHTFPFNRKEH